MCGSANFSKELISLGWEMHGHDLLLDAKANVLNKELQLKYKHAILSGHFSVVHLGTECRTFSSAANPPYRQRGKWITGWPQNLRTKKRQHICKQGNDLALFSLQVMKWCDQSGTICSLENPRTSMIWEFDEFGTVYAGGKCAWHKTHLMYCAYGRPYQKKTTILCNTIGLLNRLDRGCCGSKTHTQTLKGHCWDVRKKRWLRRTSAASPYPPRMRKLWASLLDSYLSKARAS